MLPAGVTVVIILIPFLARKRSIEDKEKLKEEIEGYKDYLKSADYMIDKLDEKEKYRKVQ